MIYITRDGDMLDQVCLAYYGSVAPLPQVLAANPQLADQPPVLPSGVAITLPAVQPVTQTPAVRLWD